MSSNPKGGQGTQKSGQKPMPEREEDERNPGQQQQGQKGGQGRQQEKQDRPGGGRENR
jgi:hypothetical protein